MGKLNVFRGILLSIVFIGLGSNCFSQEETKVKVTKPQLEVTEEALLSRASSYLEVLAPDNTFTLPETITETRPGSWGYKTDELLLQFDKNDTNSIQYFTLDFSGMSPPNRDEPKISKTEVIKIVLDTLKALNIHLDEAPGAVLEIKEEAVSPSQMGYIFVGGLSYKEIPVLAGVSGILSTKDGSIKKFATIPFAPPAPIENPISEEKAIELAEQFLLDNKMTDLNFSDIRQGYDRPNQFLDMQKAPKANEFRLFWEVSFTRASSEGINSHMNNAHPIRLMVDADTGKVTPGIM